MLKPIKAAPELCRTLWKNGVAIKEDGGAWRVEAGLLLICAGNTNFAIPVAMGLDPVRLPAGPLAGEY